jgi:DNA-binding response OmpR family regulator
VQPTKKILLIEDEAFIADIYARELTKAGFNVKVARDGTTGLQALEEDTYDLLLLDIMLPGIHGLEILRQWRTKNPQSTMPVVLLTNLGQDEVIKEAFTLGAKGYLIKASYTPKQVVNEVFNALGNKAAPAPGTPPVHTV